MADSELTNYKSGIDLNFGDSASTAADKTVNYMEEYFYSSKAISDRKVVYIKSDLNITASHNSRNVAGNDDGTREMEPVSTSQGDIIFKPDGDQRFDCQPLTDWERYSVPFSFDDLNYGAYGDSGISVVGSTGSGGTSPLNNTNRTSFYGKGVLDSVGDEWHTLTVADDDTGYGSIDPTFACSDGKIYYFVVNPKTPCMTVRATGNAEFYTTPPKKYFIPKIYDQTTYFHANTGTVTFEIHDLYGNNVFYRINGGSFTNAGTDNITLDQDDFLTGTNTLEYYYDGNAAYTKTRIVVKDPTHPSLVEDHGNRFWGNNPKNWDNDIVPRLETMETDNADATWLVSWSDTNFWSKETQILADANTGKRNTFGTATEKTILAKYHGWTAARTGGSTTYADLAMMALMEYPTSIDPVGMELQQNFDPVPCREIVYRGYYDYRVFFDAAIAYDLIAANYRSDQHSNGLTPIQDYYIRDAMARQIHWLSLEIAGYTLGSTPGMWDSARMQVGAWISAAMPSYDTDYFGTCGLDGSTTSTVNNPFPSVAYTWKELFLDQSYSLSSFPNPQKTIGIEVYQCTESGKFNDDLSYSSSTLQGSALVSYWTIMAQYAPDFDLTYSKLVQSNAASGNLEGTVFNTGTPGPPPTGSYVPIYRAWAAIQNNWYPDFRDNANATMLSLSSTEDESIERQSRFLQPLAQLYYDHYFTNGFIKKSSNASAILI